MISATSKLAEIRRKELQEQLDEFYERMGIIHPGDVAEKPGVARRGWRAMKGQKTEKEEKLPKLPKHLRYR